MNRSLNRSMDRSMDEKLYNLIEANVQITNETIAQLESEKEDLQKDLDANKGQLVKLKSENTKLRHENAELTNQLEKAKSKKSRDFILVGFVCSLFWALYSGWHKIFMFDQEL